MTWMTVLTERKPEVIDLAYARIVKGTYGKHYDLDENGDEVERPKIKRGRGRPKKLEGINFSYSPEMLVLESIWSGINLELYKGRSTK